MRSLSEAVGICLLDRRNISRDAVTITGPLTTYEARIDGNSRLWRHFCQTCGSAISTGRRGVHPPLPAPVLPDGFMRIRHYGFLGNRHRRIKIA
jgi:hypothetical protein